MKKKITPLDILLEKWLKKHLKKGDVFFDVTSSDRVFVISKYAPPKNTK